MNQRDDNNKIEGISRKYDVMNGDASDITRFTPEEANQLGKVVNSNGEKISEITPAIMILNQSEKGWRARLRALIHAGADIDSPVTYYGETKTARDLLKKYRGGDDFIN